VQCCCHTWLFVLSDVLKKGFVGVLSSVKFCVTREHLLLWTVTYLFCLYVCSECFGLNDKWMILQDIVFGKGC